MGGAVEADVAPVLQSRGQGSDMLLQKSIASGGGEAAQAVGDALAALGRHHQVLVVTHLAQVAATADAHVSVSKKVKKGATFATARHLPADERVDEIARMLSGSSTQLAREHARELLAELPV